MKHTIFLLVSLICIASASAASITCPKNHPLNGNVQQPTQNLEFKNAVNTLYVEFDRLTNTRNLKESRSARISKSPGSLKEDIKLADCLMSNLNLTSPEFIVTVNDQIRIFEVEKSIFIKYGPLLPTYENGGILENDILRILSENRITISRLKVVNNILNQK